MQGESELSRLVGDWWSYALAIGGAWRAALGGMVPWLVSLGWSKWVHPRTDKNAWEPRLRRLGTAWLVLCLVLSPFGVWRAQRTELTTAKNHAGFADSALRELRADLPEIEARARETGRNEIASQDRELRQQLNDFIAECWKILGELREGPVSDYRKAIDWRRRVKAFLSRRLGANYAAEFETAGDHPTREESQVSGYTEDNLRAQRRRLEEYLVRLPK